MRFNYRTIYQEIPFLDRKLEKSSFSEAALQICAQIRSSPPLPSPLSFLSTEILSDDASKLREYEDGVDLQIREKSLRNVVFIDACPGHHLSVPHGDWRNTCRDIHILKSRNYTNFQAPVSVFGWIDHACFFTLI